MLESDFGQLQNSTVTDVKVVTPSSHNRHPVTLNVTLRHATLTSVAGHNS